MPHLRGQRITFLSKVFFLHVHKYLLALSSYGEEEQQQHGRGTLGFPHWVPGERQYFDIDISLTYNKQSVVVQEEDISHILKQYISSHGFSYLVEFEFKAKYVAKRERFTHVGLNQRQEELVLISSALVHLQDYVQHTVWVQVETSCRQKEEATRSSWIKTDIYCVCSHKNRAALIPAAVVGIIPVEQDLLPGGALNLVYFLYCV